MFNARQHAASGGGLVSSTTSSRRSFRGQEGCPGHAPQHEAHTGEDSPAQHDRAPRQSDLLSPCTTENTLTLSRSSPRWWATTLESSPSPTNLCRTDAPVSEPPRLGPSFRSTKRVVWTREECARAIGGEIVWFRKMWERG